MAPNSLWTPTGEVALQEKGRVPINQPTVVALSYMQLFAQTHNVTMICKKCNGTIEGKNNDSTVKAGKPLTITCTCTEWYFDASDPACRNAR